MTKHALQNLLESADIEVMSYRGRGMYGKSCLATTDGNLLQGLLQLCLYEADSFTDSEKDDICQALGSIRTDSLGRDTVTYFPGICFEGEAEEAED